MFPVLSCSVLFGCLTSILQRLDVVARPKLLDSYHLSPGARLVACATVFGIFLQLDELSAPVLDAQHPFRTADPTLFSVDLSVY